MIEAGDMVECIDDSLLNYNHPKIVNGIRYVVNEVSICDCGQVRLAIGLIPAIPFTISQCDCGRHRPRTPYARYRASRFRKIETNYKVVEVSESITEQAKEDSKRFALQN